MKSTKRRVGSEIAREATTHVGAGAFIDRRAAKTVPAAAARKAIAVRRRFAFSSS